ncbi:hypothetical protein BABINDRAFT_160444 [Babjeviella inositovora NRRL Y-12698]|uniref:Uncharacterized protein n=1 Tax=Babjeviella inositovora NRRL Y-12698 TaxID=984486 RepID=A0A1E3QTZ1_9ASCO|nr:uncharacterized protein BABINDRAFT_160444 [Babjeviella inositovora NRRL Y-12698]ODQ81024.1 hypothetical protein BABINDRAFT_160444 [Babjeviella inositovora NRRL Y-12698]
MDELRSTRVSLEAINSLTKGILKDVKTSVSNQHAIGGMYRDREYQWTILTGIADIKGIQSIVNRIPK